MEGTVLVTGGSGTLGQAVVRRLLKERDAGKIVVFGRDEASQAKMLSETEMKTTRLSFEIGDVTSKDSVRRALARHKATHVVHAAAMKHVPMAEKNPSECIETNVIGSRNVLQASLESGTVGAVVLVSTDKAAQPTNTYGLSKALMERMAPEFIGLGGMRVSATRFGNLVGSRGSVLEMFLRQLRTQGIVTVTDPTMTRFFLRTTQAADTVVYALKSGTGGSVLIPQMKAALLEDFVKAAIEFSRVQGKMSVVGLRPGEKRHEMLVTEDEASRSIQPNEFLGIAVTPSVQAKPALKGALSSELVPKMGQDELLGMISEVGREFASV
jgi:FlaA1/EpsC-like NDP-sugar epimerase